MREISNDGCTAAQSIEISKMAEERQIVASVGEQVLAVQSGKQKALSKAEGAEMRTSLDAAAKSYDARFSKLTRRLSELNSGTVPQTK